MKKILQIVVYIRSFRCTWNFIGFFFPLAFKPTSPFSQFSGYLFGWKGRFFVCFFFFFSLLSFSNPRYLTRSDYISIKSLLHATLCCSNPLRVVICQFFSHDRRVISLSSSRVSFPVSYDILDAALSCVPLRFCLVLSPRLIFVLFSPPRLLLSFDKQLRTWPCAFVAECVVLVRGRIVRRNFAIVDYGRRGPSLSVESWWCISVNGCILKILPLPENFRRPFLKTKHFIWSSLHSVSTWGSVTLSTFQTSNLSSFKNFTVWQSHYQSKAAEGLQDSSAYSTPMCRLSTSPIIKLHSWMKKWGLITIIPEWADNDNPPSSYP